MRVMRSHNLAYFRWFLEHKKSRLHIAVQTGFNAYSGNIKCVLCDRIKWYQNTLSLCSSRSQSSSSLIAVASSIAVGSRPSEERRAAHCLLKFVVLEAQHDAVLRIGGYPAVLHLLGRLEYKSFFAH